MALSKRANGGIFGYFCSNLGKYRTAGLHKKFQPFPYLLGSIGMLSVIAPAFHSIFGEFCFWFDDRRTIATVIFFRPLIEIGVLGRAFELYAVLMVIFTTFFVTIEWLKNVQKMIQ